MTESFAPPADTVADPIVDTQEVVSLPPSANLLANSLEKFVEDLLSAHASGTGLLSAAVQAGMKDLVGAFPNVGAVVDEAKAEPIGVAEAFAIAGFKLARKMYHQ